MVRVDDRSLSNAVNVAGGNSVLRNGRVILVVALIAAVGGFFIGLLREGRGRVYEAEAVVAASTSPLPGENFADLGIALFRTDTVLQPVIDELDLDMPPQSLLSEGFLTVESVNNAVAVRITAQASDPQLAPDLANAAADSFAAALTNSDMGDFAIFEDDEVSEKPGRSPLQSTLLAAALGVVLGGAILMLRNLIVQPILTREEALGVYPADVAFSARVHIGRTLPFVKGSSYKARKVFPHGLASAIRRSTAAGEGTDRYSSCYVLVERKRRGDRALRALLEELRLTDGPDQGQGTSTRDLNWIPVSDHRLGAKVEDAAVIIALISQGVSRRSLGLLTEELLVAPGRRLLVLVFVGTSHRRPSVSEAKSGLQQMLARWRSSMRRQFSGSRSGGA